MTWIWYSFVELAYNNTLNHASCTIGLLSVSIFMMYSFVKTTYTSTKNLLTIYISKLISYLTVLSMKALKALSKAVDSQMDLSDATFLFPMPLCDGPFDWLIGFQAAKCLLLTQQRTEKAI